MQAKKKKREILFSLLGLIASCRNQSVILMKGCCQPVGLEAQHPREDPGGSLAAPSCCARPELSGWEPGPRPAQLGIAARSLELRKHRGSQTAGGSKFRLLGKTNASWEQDASPGQIGRAPIARGQQLAWCRGCGKALGARLQGSGGGCGGLGVLRGEGGCWVWPPSSSQKHTDLPVPAVCISELCFPHQDAGRGAGGSVRCTAQRLAAKFTQGSGWS